MARKFSRMWLRRLLRFSLWLVAGVVTTLIVGFFALFYTDWGQRRMTSWLEERAERTLRGDLEIGDLSGDPFSGFSLRDLRLRRPDGRIIAAIDRLDIGVELLPLFAKEVRLDLNMSGPAAHIRKSSEGSLDATGLLREEPDAAPSAWSVSIPSFEIEDGTVTFSDAQRGIEVTRLSASGTLEAAGGLYLWRVRDLSAQWRASSATRRLRGTLSVPLATGRAGTGSLSVIDAAVSLRSTEEGVGGRIDRLHAHRTAQGRFAVSARTQISADLIGGLLDRPDVRASSELAIDVRGDDDRATLEVAGGIGGGDLLVRGELRELDEAELFVSLRGIDPARFWAHAPTGDLDLKLSATGSVSAERGQLSANIRGGVSSVTVEGASAVLRYESGSIQIDQSSLRARSSDLADLPLPVSLRGDATLRATAKGSIERLEARATVESDRLAWRSVVARSARLTGQVAGIPHAVDWRARLAVGALTVDGDRIGRLRSRASGTPNRVSGRIAVRGEDRLTARIAARRRGPGYAISLRRASGRVRGVRIRGAEGQLTVSSSRVELEELGLRTSAGNLSARGTLALPLDAPLRGDISAGAESLDLAIAARLLGLPALTGSASMQLAVALPRGPARIRARARGLRWAGQDESLSLALGAHYEHSNLDARLRVAGLTVGRAEVDFSRSAPDRLLSQEWTSLDPSQISRLHLRVHRLRVGPLARLLRVDPPLSSGVARGELTLDRDRDPALRLDLRAASVRLHDRAPRFAVALRGEVSEEASRTSFRLRGVRRSAIELTADTDLGMERIGRALRSWLGTGRRVWPGVEASADVSIHPPELAKLGFLPEGAARWVPTTVTARTAVAARRGAAVWRLTSKARVVLAHEGLRQEVALHGSIGPSSWNLRGLLARDHALEATAWGTYDGIDGVRARLSSFDLGSPIGKAIEGLSGAQELGGKISGSLMLAADESPRVDLKVRNLTTVHRALPIALHDGRARLILRDSRLRVRVSASSRGGTVNLEGQASLDGYQLETGQGKIAIEKVPVTLSSGPIEVTSKARIRTHSRNGIVVVDVEVDGGRARHSSQPGISQLHSADMPDDIVFAAERRRSSSDDGEQTAVSFPDLSVHVHSRRAVLVRGSDINTRIRFDVTAHMSRGRETIFRGRVQAQRGTITLRDRDWTIETAILSLGGRRPSNPTIDIELSHEFEEAVVTILVRGTPDELEVELASNPPVYTQSQLLSLVLTGSAGGSSGFAVAEGAVGAATNLLGPEVKRGIEQTLPVDTIRLTGDEGSGLLLGRWITPNIFVAYVSNFRDQGDEDLESPHRAVLDYQLSPQWGLEAGYGNRTEGNIDLLWSLRF